MDPSGSTFAIVQKESKWTLEWFAHLDELKRSSKNGDALSRQEFEDLLEMEIPIHLAESSWGFSDGLSHSELKHLLSKEQAEILNQCFIDVGVGHLDEEAERWPEAMKKFNEKCEGVFF